MNIPEAAIGEAAAAIQFVDRSNLTRTARAAIEAAMPAIREALAQEIEAAAPRVAPPPQPDSQRPIRNAWFAVARIVRGGTP